MYSLPAYADHMPHVKPRFKASRPLASARKRTVLLPLSDAEKTMLEALATDCGLTLVATLRCMIRDQFQSLEKSQNSGPR